MIISTILISDRMAFVFFDHNSICSYVIVKFSMGMNLDCDLDTPMYVSTPVRVFLCSYQVCHVCPIMFLGF